MFLQYVISLVISYKYLILFPAALLEGHGISLATGFISQMGYLNPFVGGLVIICGNLTGDAILYWLGYHKGESFVRKFGKYVGINDDTISKSKDLFHSRKKHILFFSKITNGFGLAMAVLFTAGIAKIPFKQFMLWNLLGEIVWTGVLVSVGYIFGGLYVNVENIILRVSLVVSAIVIAFIAYRIRKYFLKNIK